MRDDEVQLASNSLSLQPSSNFTWEVADFAQPILFRGLSGLPDPEIELLCLKSEPLPALSEIASSATVVI